MKEEKKMEEVEKEEKAMEVNVVNLEEEELKWLGNGWEG